MNLDCKKFIFLRRNNNVFYLIKSYFCRVLCKNLRGNIKARGIICEFKCPREINNKLIDSTNSFWVIDKSKTDKCFVF